MNPPPRVGLPGPTYPDGYPVYHPYWPEWEGWVFFNCQRCDTTSDIHHEGEGAAVCPKCGNVELLHHLYARMLVHEGITDATVIERN